MHNWLKNFINCPFKRWAVVTKLLLIGCCSSYNINASEPYRIKHSIRALGMGNAFVAVANDENALFYNPAGLKSIQHYFFEILTINLTLNENLRNLVSGDTSTETLPLGSFIGEKIYFESNIATLSIAAPNWAYSIFSRVLLDSDLHNPVVPNLKTILYGQAGIMGGYAHSFMDNTLDVGIGVKAMRRAGIDRTIYLSDVFNENYVDEVLEDNVNVEKISPDIGMSYHLTPIYDFKTKVAFVARNIGDMDFGSAGQVPASYDIGIASERKLLDFDFIMAAYLVDLSNLASTAGSVIKHLRLGLEIGAFMQNNNHQALSYRVGTQGLYPSFGLTFNPPYVPMTLDLAFWSTDIGTATESIRDNRQSLQISINF